MLLLVLYTLMGVTSWVFLGWMPSFIGEHFRLAEGKSGLIAAGFMNCGALVGYLAGGAWADRWSRTHISARAWVAIIGLALTLPCVLLIANTSVLALAAAGLLFFGLARALPDANMIPILFHFVDRRHRGTRLFLRLRHDCGRNPDLRGRRPARRPHQHHPHVLCRHGGYGTGGRAAMGDSAPRRAGSNAGFAGGRLRPAHQICRVLTAIVAGGI